MSKAAAKPLALTAATPARTALADMASAFHAAGLDTPDLDARFLTQDILGLDGAQLLADPLRPLGASAPALVAAARRRLAREPVSRILGWREFFGRRFKITPDVLDPRSDTETVIELALEIGRERGWDERDMTVFDVGVGSGAIAVTLLAEWPHATAYASDVSRAALAVAQENADALGVAGRLKLIEGRGLAGYAGPLDLVVSNPPYIPSLEIAGLDPDVRDYDPTLALDGGADGLFIYRQIASEIMSLRRGAEVVVEVGDGQSAHVLEIFRAAGGVRTRTALDLSGRPRAVATEIHC